MSNTATLNASKNLPDPAITMINYYLLELIRLVYGSNEFSSLPWTPSLPCPTTILARVGTSKGDYCAGDPNMAYCRFPNMITVHSALSRCSNVQELDIYLEVGGCAGPEVDPWDFAFEELSEGVKYPSLKGLSFDGYSFGGLYAREEEDVVDPNTVTDVVLYVDEWDAYEPQWSQNAYVDRWNEEKMKDWEVAGGKPRTNLDMWIEKMDWSQLEELSINTARSEMVDVETLLPQRVKGLKALSLDSLPFIRGLREHQLDKLVWVGKTRAGQLTEILELQGRRLKSLEYRCHEKTCVTWPEHVKVSALPVLAPELQHVSINLPRHNGTWPFEELRTLATMPALKTADLFFRMQPECLLYGQYLGRYHRCGNAYREWRDESWATGSCREDNRFASPMLESRTALEMFTFMRAHNFGEELTKVTFKTGDWLGPYDGPLRGDEFLDDRRTMIICDAVDGREGCEERR